MAWAELARAGNEAGDEILLRQRADIYEIRYNGLELMSNVNFQSELRLAEKSLRLFDHPIRHVLIAGLGMGFTLRAALDNLGKSVRVTVCELVPEIIQWNRDHIGHLADNPLGDGRVEVVTGDVMDLLRQRPAHYDLILMDTDNGPDITVRADNEQIYQDDGLSLVRRALRPGGHVAFWSATASQVFEQRLDEHGLDWHREDVNLIGGRADAFHYIYLVHGPQSHRPTSSESLRPLQVPVAIF